VTLLMSGVEGILHSAGIIDYGDAERLSCALIFFPAFPQRANIGIASVVHVTQDQ
jgi:hypothetical protein